MVWGQLTQLMLQWPETRPAKQSPEFPIVTVVGSRMGLLPSHSQPTFILGLLLLVTGRKDSLPFLLDRSLGE